MFNFKSKKETPQEQNVITKTEGYPAIVHEIHNEFMTAGDKILVEAKEILRNGGSNTLAKAHRLSKLGFKNIPEVKQITDLFLTEETASLIDYYNINYPNNKFITEKQVEAICLKYGLMCGDVSIYKGFVPEKNLAYIESFSLKDNDKDIVELINTCVTNVSLGWYKESDLVKNQHIIAGGELKRESKVERGIYEKAISLGVSHHCVYIERRKSSVQFKICAPLKDMDTTGLRVSGYKIEEHYPDPVVLHPVAGGYLIVTAWGDEASDENVVNEKMN